ncbi:LEAF RUST 10 DISEASE-RESISTANCE LOCUS RECEPTOR-LIKE PROTEIN KINASE-like 1.1 [Senna tora]|uniref:LEAF RUST 10 DISEASE-RESISTANCE LOCUS RECEPTOR-LIKE PROTEIN KINASE-like 1.1 n=1 Tax=Senna tora TaxID=362788 RepID=A0A834WLS0_9FABA|nr:LEAF RUST 10 DISEASE-RESISTANCE LOCUS RECEPTOR-LIKE PROTEIN KINASE-like 1.1 [Senna tora]
MIQVFAFRLLFYTHLTLLLSASYGNGSHDKRPPSFSCGSLGRIHYPFTKAEEPECGLIAIHGCDNSSSDKAIKLENGRSFLVTSILQQDGLNSSLQITSFDQVLHDRLQSNGSCEAFNNNITLPESSPLVSFDIKYNITLYRCNHSLNVSPPTGFIKHLCPDYNIYHYSILSTPNHTELSSFSACSVLVLPKKDLPDTDDLRSFLTGQIVLDVRLSDDCDKCYNRKGGLCSLDSNRSFKCDKASGHKFKVKLALGLGLGLSIGLLGILIMWLLFRRHYKQKYASSNVQLQTTNKNAFDPYLNAESGRAYFDVPLFSYEELEKATNNFDRSRELGTGGFGMVYYGKLQDGRDVAVKRLYDHNYRRLEQFMNEIEILTRMRHKNLVSLYGCTSRHSRELLLVYEYIPNGTVSCHLHGEQAYRGLLPWPIRMKLAIETASALAYLHAHDTIHRDVKTNNILLDSNFQVKVADFGLSRLFPNDVTHVSTAPQGTPGYVDPEYHQCYQLTSKSDVYSFGVVLIELVSSMEAVDMSRHKDEINLANLAIKKIQNSEFGELVDPSLGFESDSNVRRMIVSVGELAFQCLQRDRELRPSMKEVLEMLRRIESGNEELQNMEEVDLHDAVGISHSHSGPMHPSSPPTPDCDETGLLKSTKSLPSPKAVADKRLSDSTTPTGCGSARSTVQKSSSGVSPDFLDFLTNYPSCRILTSSNGLILGRSTKCNNEIELFISNPATKSWLPIPTPDYLKENPDFDINIAFECNNQDSHSDDYMMFCFEAPDEWASSCYGVKFYSPKEGIWKGTEKGFFIGGRPMQFDMHVYHKKAFQFISNCFPSLNKNSPYFRPYIMSYNIEDGESRMIRVPKEARRGSHDSSCKMGIYKWGKARNSDESICLVRLRKCVFTAWVSVDYEASKWRRVLKIRVKAILGIKEEAPVIVRGFKVMNGDYLVFTTKKKVYGYGLGYKNYMKLQEICEHQFDHGGDKVCFTSYSDTLRSCEDGATTLPLTQQSY